MAATLDVITLAEAKASLNIPTADTTFDTPLAAYVTAVSGLLDRLCGPIVQRTVTAELQDGGGFACFLEQYPVTSITSVVEYLNTTATTLTAESNTVKTGNQYSIELKTGVLYRRGDNRDRRYAQGRKNISVTYEAGRSATTAAVELRFKSAAQLILANLWRRELGSGNVTFGPTVERTVGATYAIPNAAKQMILDDFKAPRVL